ncbi:MAG: hypothetical protein NTV29_12350 [Planctomycetota bacterium]|nr:hypothetical protein [Planctomycetota bacterium]
MERTPSAGSLSGNFLGSEYFDTFGSSTIFGSPGGSNTKAASKTAESTNKQSGLWGNGSVAARDGGQWPLGSQTFSSTKP